MQEFADFLGAQPPFDALSAGDLASLARAVQVEYFAAGTVIVAADGPALDHMYVIRAGAAEIIDRGRIIDLLGPGDTFGHVSILTGLPPALSVRAAEDTLCYLLPDPRTLVGDASALRFGYFGTMIYRQRVTGADQLTGMDVPVSRYMRPIVWCDAAAPVRHAARMIGDAGQSCALVRGRAGHGIVTDRDFRQRVATGEVSADAPVGDIMSVPVAAVSQGTTVASAFVRMVEAGLHHLVIEDEQQHPVGVVRATDLASAGVRDPLLLRAAVSKATTVEQLADACALLSPTLVDLHDTGMPAAHIGALLSAVVDAVIRRLLQLADQETASPSRSWLLLGSMARREPLPGSDVDTGIVWAGGPSPAGSGKDIRGAAARILDDMERCGLRRCPDGANADNPLFSRARPEWTSTAEAWITDPTREGALLLSSIIADSRPLTAATLGRAVTDTIHHTARSREFLDGLLRFTLMTRPPVGFVRNFVVEHSGEHRGRLDLKQGGLRPVAALARWLAIAMGDVRGSTPERLRRAASAGLLTQQETDTLTGAFTDIYELAFAQEIAAIRVGNLASSWITPGELDPLARRHLRESFRAISSIQARIDGDWPQRVA